MLIGFPLGYTVVVVEISVYDKVVVFDIFTSLMLVDRNEFLDMRPVLI